MGQGHRVSPNNKGIPSDVAISSPTRKWLDFGSSSCQNLDHRAIFGFTRLTRWFVFKKINTLITYQKSLLSPPWTFEELCIASATASPLIPLIRSVGHSWRLKLQTKSTSKSYFYRATSTPACCPVYVSSAQVQTPLQLHNTPRFLFA